MVNSGADGLWVPQGWSTKVLARTGEKVGSTNYVWSAAPDGAASFVDPGGVGWWVAINHEASSRSGGGASAIHLSEDGEVIAAHRIIGGSSYNCAGGATPWGTWLSGRRLFGGVSGRPTRRSRTAVSCDQRWASSPTRRRRWTKPVRGST